MDACQIPPAQTVTRIGIYSARCRLFTFKLHKIRFVTKKEAKRLHYCHGEADTKILQIAIDRNEINTVAIR
jgi:hypothetical protein